MRSSRPYATESRGGHGKQRRLADGIEGLGEQRPDQRHRARALGLRQAAKEAALEPDRRHYLAGFSRQHRA